MGRYIVEDCDSIKVRNLVTLGTPNMGISEMPMLGCDSLEDSALCSI